MKKLTLVYLETCLPDYFQGFSGYVYAVPLPAKPRKGEVLDELRQAIAREEPYIGEEYPTQETYKELDGQACELFEGEDLRTKWSKLCDDLSESYAYFGLKEEEEA